MKQNQTETPQKRSLKRTNEILEDHGDWLIVDIGTSKFPDATMAVDTDVFNANDGGRIYADNYGPNRYIYGRFTISGKSALFHRHIIDAGKLFIDHIEHGTMNFIDNRRTNLRVVTVSQNHMNRGVYRNSSSGITGVCRHKKNRGWMAHIKINGVSKHLGNFDNIDFAIGARQQAEREYFGDFAFKRAK